MSNIVIFGPTQSGKTTLLGYLATAMLRHPYFNEEVYKNFKLIKKLTETDEFNIGDPRNPEYVNTDVILPSFISMDRNELRKFRDGSTEGTTKQLHRKQIAICMTTQEKFEVEQSENENVSCTFLDLPGFRTKISDKYRGFFEGDVGIAVIKLSEVLSLDDAINKENSENVDQLRRRLIEPLRVWCDYRAPNKLVIAISQIDRQIDIGNQCEDSTRYVEIERAVNRIKEETRAFNKNCDIPVSPISVRIINVPNYKNNAKMQRFFTRQEQNIYTPIHIEPKPLPGDGTLISCIKKILPSTPSKASPFSLGSVHRVMRTTVNGTYKTVLEIQAIHGSIHVNDNVMLGPVLNKTTNEITFANCKLLSLKADGVKQVSQTLFEGNVGGAIMKDIKDIDDGKTLSLSHIAAKSDITILKSTIIYTGDRIDGDIVTLEIKRSEHSSADNQVDFVYDTILHSLMPSDQILVFWYGKKILTSVVELIFDDEKIRISLLLSKGVSKSVGHFSLPCDASSQLLHADNVLFAVPKSYYDDSNQQKNQSIYTYISSTVVGIKDSAQYHTIKIKASDLLELDVLFSDVVHYTKVKDIAGQQQEIYSVTITKQKNHDIHSALIKIGRSIRSCWGRQIYKQLNGVEMSLDS